MIPSDTFWRSISRDNVTTFYGKTAASRIADPADPSRIFTWLVCESFDDKGNAAVYDYVAEDGRNVDTTLASERNRTDASRSANRYLKRVATATAPRGSCSPISRNGMALRARHGLWRSRRRQSDHRPNDELAGASRPVLDATAPASKFGPIAAASASSCSTASRNSGRSRSSFARSTLDYDDFAYPRGSDTRGRARASGQHAASARSCAARR